MIQRSFAGLKFVSPAFSTPSLSSGPVNRSDAWHIAVALPAQQRCAQTISANVLNSFFSIDFVGFPAIIVAISLAATQTAGYGTAHACWLDISSGLIWAFIAPVISIILVSEILPWTRMSSEVSLLWILFLNIASALALLKRWRLSSRPTMAIYSLFHLFIFFRSSFFSFALSSVHLFMFICIRTFTLSQIHLSPIRSFTRSFVRSLSPYFSWFIRSLSHCFLWYFHCIVVRP